MSIKKQLRKHLPSFVVAMYNRIYYVYFKATPKRQAAFIYSQSTGKKIDWHNPQDLNQKINYLKFHSNTSEWSRLADKFRVREYIEEKGYSHILVKLYGVWESADDIDFSQLPSQFVMKLNNGSGTVWIINDKNEEDLEELRKTINLALKQTFGIWTAEPHYARIKPIIIAEELLCNKSISSSLIDYKMWCFNGNFFGTWVCYNRNGYNTFTEWHDENWGYRPEWSVFTNHYKDGKGIVPCPINYAEMIKIACDLSRGFPQVRIDLYNVNGKIYFGEMTFTSAGGYMDFYSQEALDIMGAMTKL